MVRIRREGNKEEGKDGGKRKGEMCPKRVENKIGRTLNLILNNRPSVLFCFLKIKRKLPVLVNIVFVTVRDERRIKAS